MSLQTQNVQPIRPTGPDIVALMYDYLSAKTALDVAKKTVSDLESRLIAEVGAKEEGSLTVHIDDHKVTTTGKMTRKLDPKAWAKLAPQLPETLTKMLIRNKPELNLRAYRDLADANPTAFELVSQAVITKPAKPTIKVEPQ